MYPIIAKLGPFTLHTFGVVLATAILVGSAILSREARRLGDPQITEEKLQRLIWYIVLAVVFGGRLMHCIVEWRYFSAHPAKILAIWEGGLVFYGGFIATFFTVVGFAIRNKIRILRLCDLIAPSAFFGQFIGRWGCLVAGDDYGKPMSEPIRFFFGKAVQLPAWLGITFTSPDSLVPLPLRGVPLEPVQIFMSMKALLISGILFWIARKKKFDGQVAGVTFVLYSFLRPIIELFRGDEDRGFVFGMSTAQFTSIFCFTLGVLILWMAPRRLLADDLAVAQATPSGGSGRRGKKGLGGA